MRLRIYDSSVLDLAVGTAYKGASVCQHIGGYYLVGFCPVGSGLRPATPLSEMSRKPNYKKSFNFLNHNH